MRVMRGYGASRAVLFATLDRPNLQSLPPEPYTFARWKCARVAPDYHVEVDSSWYSVPFRLIRQEVDTRTCLGIIALARTCEPTRLDAACRRGLSIRARSFL